MDPHCLNSYGSCRREMVTGGDQKVESVLVHREGKRQSSHTRKSWRATGALEEGVGWVWLVGDGYVTYTHLGEGSQLFWQKELFLVSDTISGQRDILGICFII